MLVSCNASESFTKWADCIVKHQNGETDGKPNAYIALVWTEFVILMKKICYPDKTDEIGDE